MNLKMQMRPRRAAGVADVGNDLPGFDLLACGDADARAVRVQCRQSTAVVELDGEVIVPATGSGHCSAPPPSVVSEPGVRISPPSSPIPY